jgi:phage tail sheath protein FI
MLQYTYPGIYTREIPTGVRTITSAPTSVALFVGPTRSGIDNRPTRVSSYPDFERAFGGLSQTSSLSYSVMHFFANGGGEAFVIRIPTKDSKAAQSTLKQDNAGAAASFTVTSLSSGVAGNDVLLEFDGFETDPQGDKKRFNLVVVDRLTGRVERYGNLATTPTSSRFAPAIVNDPDTGSKLIMLTLPAAAVDKEGPRASGSIYKMANPQLSGNFSEDVKLNLSIAILKPDGSADTGINNLSVTVHPGGTPKPATAFELVTKLVAALNAAIRADAASADIMGDDSVEGESFADTTGTYIRLRTSRPGSAANLKRVADATVTIADPGAGNAAAKYLTATGLSLVGAANPSRIQLGASYGAGGPISGAQVAGVDGDPNGQPDTNVFKQAVMDLDVPDPFFNILCLPDLVRPSPTDPMATLHSGPMTIYQEAARICKNKHAFLIIDPLPNVISAGAAQSWKSLGITFQSTHSAAYFPNIRVDDPLVPGAIKSHPPSGAIAGVYARTDGQFGVWKAPAGTDARLDGVYGPSIVLSDDEHGLLNPLGLNVIRQFPIYGTVSFGSRTVDGSNALASDFKYIPVRRTASYILRSLSDALRWAVHSPNGEVLWSQLRVNVTAFMYGLFRQGAFKGVSAREAYFVQCDSTTTTPDDINQGIVNIVVGFAPLKPAEFVVISLRQIVQPTV